MTQVRESNALLQAERVQLAARTAEAEEMLATLGAREADIAAREKEVANQETVLAAEKTRMAVYAGDPPPTVVELNVGGTAVTTFTTTLLKHSDTFFTALLSGRYPLTRDAHNRIVIDRPPRPFLAILDWLRTGLWQPDGGEQQYAILLNELDFYGLAPHLKDHLVGCPAPKEVAPPCLEEYFTQDDDTASLLEGMENSCAPFEYSSAQSAEEDEPFHVTPPREVGDGAPSTVPPHELKYPQSRQWRWVADPARLFTTAGGMRAVAKAVKGAPLSLTPIFVSETIASTSDQRSVLKVKTVGIKAGLEIQYGLFKGPTPTTLLNKRNPSALGWCGRHEGTTLYPTSVVGCIDYSVVMEVTKGVSAYILRVYNSKELKGCTEKGPEWLRVPDSEITFAPCDEWRFVVLAPAGVALTIMS